MRSAMGKQARLALAASALALASLSVQVARAAPVPDDIRFIGTQMGASVEGHFRHFKSDILFNAKDLAKSHARVEIDLNSVDLSSEESETEVKGKNWFNVALFPKATFESTQFKALGGGQYEVAGRLTIKGITRTLSIPLQVHSEGATQVIEGGTTLKRTDFKVGEGEWADPDTVGEQVQVSFHVTVPR
jgi:polyisoprenoid-binding protein YceI